MFVLLLGCGSRTGLVSSGFAGEDDASVGSSFDASLVDTGFHIDVFPPDHGIEPDAGSTGCGPTTCKGCCDADGKCRRGNTLDACGTGGEACERCPADPGVTCSGKPVPGCVKQLEECTPESCPGCCVIYPASQFCSLSGLAANACGHGGVACVDCMASGMTCSTAGRCEPK